MENSQKLQLILEETFDLESEVELNEATGEKTYVIKGTFSTPDKMNRNGRIYPKKIWEDNVAAYQKEISEKTVNSFMEKEHPPRTEVDPEKAIARIRKLEMRDGKVYGEAVLFNKEDTKDIRERIDAGKRIGVSSRGVGKLNGNIVEKFTLITYDIVKSPSDYGANTVGFNESLILENVEIEADGHGGWICTPKGCTLRENKYTESKEPKHSKCEQKVDALIEAFEAFSNKSHIQEIERQNEELKNKFEELFGKSDTISGTSKLRESKFNARNVSDKVTDVADVAEAVSSLKATTRKAFWKAFDKLKSELPTDSAKHLSAIGDEIEEILSYSSTKEVR